MHVSVLAGRLYLLAVPALLTLLVPATLTAQSTPSDPVDPSFVSFEHDGRNVTGYAAYFTADGGAPLRFDLGPRRPDKNGEVVARLPPLSPGTYSVAVAAYNAAGESLPVPGIPGRFRVTRSTESSGQQPQEQTPARTAAPQPVKTEPSKAPRGFLGRIYGVVVGSDDDASGK